MEKSKKKSVNKNTNVNCGEKILGSFISLDI